jgi:hypothetical protein
MNSKLITVPRTSPEISSMYRHVSKDGTIWAFESKRKMDNFKRRHLETRRSKHFLSPREALSQSLNLTNLYGE